MAIESYKTRTGTELVAEGILKGVYLNELKEKKDYGTGGKSWVPTHSVNIIVDDDKIGLGLTDKDVIRCKDSDGNYHDLVKGQKVSVVVTEKGEYNGKMQYSGFTKDVIILENVSQSDNDQQGAKSGGGGFKKDMSGVESGHAINCAIGLLAGDAADSPDAVIELAKKFHDLTKALKAEYAKKYPEVSDYDIGARVGQAVLSATQIVSEFEDVEGIARQTIEVISPAMLEYVKAVPEEEKAPAQVKKTAAKKAPAKKAAPKKESEPVDDADIPDTAFEDLDDDIPF